MYAKLKSEELVPLTPGNIIMIGNLKFILERFNTTAVAKIGNRTKMEDTYIMAHDLGIDSALKASMYAVIDGHGGDWCTKFLQ